MALDPVRQEMADVLTAILDARRADLTTQKDYYTGDRPRIVLADRTIPLYSTIVNQARSPWAELVVDQASERMQVTGFRIITPDESDEDVDADSLCWDIWQFNDGDMWSQVGFQTMLLHGTSSILVEDGDELPLLSWEHPSQTAVLVSPGGRQTVAAIKRWTEGTAEVVILWTRDGAVTLTRERTREPAVFTEGDSRAVNDTGVVPIFAMRNRPDLLGGHESDLTSLYPTLDRCAQGIADRITAQLYSSSKVRYLIGAEPEFDENGNPTERTLRLATDKLLLIENPDAKAGVFDSTDLRQFIEVAKSDIAALAAISRLPTYLLSGDLVNVSREALESLSQGLVSRVEQRQVWASPALSQAMRLALRLAGDERVLDPRVRVEPIWAPVLPPSITETSDAAAKLVGAGILSATGAQDVIMNLTPTERQKVAEYQRSDALTQQGVAEIQSLFTAPAPAPEQVPAAPTEVTTGA